jgi:hypothetical protein
MYRRAAVVGVTQVRQWGATETVAQVFEKLGHNTGNMVFTEALLRVLYEPTATSFSLTREETESRDAIVLAAANWINEFDDYGWLATAIEGTTLPTFLVGVGAQAGLDHKIPRLSAGTQRMLKIISERSVLIAARGEFTCEVLAHYGITNAWPVGCPSLLLAGARGPRFSHPPSLDNVVVHATRHGFNRCDELQSWLYREAFRADLELLIQSELADVYYALGKTNNPQILARADPILQQIYQTDNVSAVADYLYRRGLFFTNFEQWTSHMRQRSFCVGSRIHATIASIIAGTPATLIAHDSRTLELAKAMGIPFVTSLELNIKESLPLELLLSTHSRENNHSHINKYYLRYLDFFKKNDLAIAPEYTVYYST